MGRSIGWDTKLGRQLYDQGHIYPDIAERCGTTTGAVAHQAYRLWGPRGVDSRAIKWDIELARSLYDQGMPHDAIAKKCRITKNTIIGYANRHWPERSPITKWDTAAARILWDEGLLCGAIAKLCGTTRSAVSGHANRNNWPKRPGDTERHVKYFPKPDIDAPKVPKILKARPIPPGARTLPDLPSLRGYY